MDLDSHYIEICKANSGAIRFQVKSNSGCAQLYLSGINPPHKDLFDITLSLESRIGNLETRNMDSTSAVTPFINLIEQFQELWLTWYNGDICLGFGDNPEPFLRYKYQNNENEMIGYIKFVKKLSLTEWIYEKSPIISEALQPKKLCSGELRWVTLIDHKLPPDALIAGFEKEPLYIACALHGHSMCPGKYVPSKRKAFVPWGGREHAKDDFQVLCGYNATWVKTGSNKIPQNAFIGGISEVRQEPLYIGRAVHEGNLINGKIHVIYHTCYIPYEGKEVEIYDQFEVLVLPDQNYRGILGMPEFDM
ncbi:uncharacterized protein LOC133518832 isoform X1 [Cydia pomonella]|uniref:uncharacterized protein LOC133518832 isoform X1 n=2 Tax=Cydia pomonella TaxID=82600 RepID=UPI002ADDCD22|nr:uncharacterized protein LOC133518832 isoform X1 [Cydia pomonella]